LTYYFVEHWDLTIKSVALLTRHAVA